MKSPLEYSKLSSGQKEDNYRRFMSSKTEIHFGFQKIRDSRIEDEVYATSMHFADNDQPDRRLVLSRCSETNYGIESIYHNQLEKNSGDLEFTRWINDKLDVNSKGFNFFDQNKKKDSLHPIEPDNITNDGQAFKKQAQNEIPSYYDHYKPVLAKRPIEESRCINNNIHKIGANEQVGHHHTKVAESNGMGCVVKDKRSSPNKEAEDGFITKYRRRSIEELQENEPKGFNSIKQTIKDHIKKTSSIISRESLSNATKRQNGKSVETSESRFSKERHISRDTKKTSELLGSIHSKTEDGNVKVRRGSIANEGNNCSLRNSSTEENPQLKQERNFTLSEIRDDVLKTENVVNPKTLRKGSIVEDHKQNDNYPKNLVANTSSKIVHYPSSTKEQSSRLNRRSSTPQMIPNKHMNVEERGDVNSSRHIIIDLSQHNLGSVNGESKKILKRDRTVDRLIKAGEEYKQKNAIKKNLKNEQEIKECTFSPKLCSRKNMNRNAGYKQNKTAIEEKSFEQSYKGVNYNRRNSVISDNGNISMNTSRNQIPGRLTVRPSKALNSNVSSTKNMRNKSISATPKAKPKTPIKFEEPSFRPTINENSKRIVNRRKSHVNEAPANAHKKFDDTKNKNFSANSNSDKILSERLLEEIHTVLEQGNYLNDTDELCEITLNNEQIITILQDLLLLPREESEMTEQMFALIEAMWLIMSENDTVNVTVKRLTMFVLAIFGLSIVDLMEEDEVFLSKSDIKEIQLGYKPFKDYKQNYKKELRRRDSQLADLRRNSSTVSQKSVNEDKMAEKYRRRVLEKAQHYIREGYLEPLLNYHLAHSDILALEKKIKLIENELKRIDKENESMIECTFKPLIHDSYITTKSDTSKLNKSSSKHLSTITTSRVDKSSTVLKLELKIKNNVKERIYLYSNDNVDAKVAKIVKKHSLTSEKAARLRNILLEQLQTMA